MQPSPTGKTDSSVPSLRAFMVFPFLELGNVVADATPSLPDATLA
jgi:hypothetical protein